MAWYSVITTAPSSLLFNLALYPVHNLLPLKAPRTSDLESGDFSVGHELVGGLLIDFEKLGQLANRQNFEVYCPAPESARDEFIGKSRRIREKTDNGSRRGQGFDGRPYRGGWNPADRFTARGPDRG